MTPEEVIEKIKKKSVDFARSHATDKAKMFYLLGKRDAASTILAMVKEDGMDALIDVAKELLKYDPNHQIAKSFIK